MLGRNCHEEKYGTWRRTGWATAIGSWIGGTVAPWQNSFAQGGFALGKRKRFGWWKWKLRRRQYYSKYSIK